MSREQLLIDLMFSAVMMMNSGEVKFKSREDAADWTTKQLINAGLKGKPMGMSWFVLEDEKK